MSDVMTPKRIAGQILILVFDDKSAAIRTENLSTIRTALVLSNFATRMIQQFIDPDVGSRLIIPPDTVRE